ALKKPALHRRRCAAPTPSPASKRYGIHTSPPQHLRICRASPPHPGPLPPVGGEGKEKQLQRHSFSPSPPERGRGGGGGGWPVAPPPTIMAQLQSVSAPASKRGRGQEGRAKDRAYFAFFFSASIRTLAVGPEEAGFWPVINCPSATVWTPQFLTLEKVAPRLRRSSSTRKGTTFVHPTASPSPLVKPVTVLPSTSGLPAGVLTWRRAPGAWQTSAKVLPAARKDSSSLIDCSSSARSHIGPWPPG